MATQTLLTQLTASCSSGGHREFTLTRNGGNPRKVSMTNDELAAAITEDDIQAFVKVIAKLHLIAKNGDVTLAITALTVGHSTVVS